MRGRPAMSARAEALGGAAPSANTVALVVDASHFWMKVWRGLRDGSDVSRLCFFFRSWFVLLFAQSGGDGRVLLAHARQEHGVLHNKW